MSRNLFFKYICKHTAGNLIEKEILSQCFLWILRNFTEQLFCRKPFQIYFFIAWTVTFYSVHWIRSSHLQMFYWKGVPKIFSEFAGNTCESVTFFIELEVYSPQLYITKENLAQVFSRTSPNDWFWLGWWKLTQN